MASHVLYVISMLVFRSVVDRFGLFQAHGRNYGWTSFSTPRPTKQQARSNSRLMEPLSSTILASIGGSIQICL